MTQPTTQALTGMTSLEFERFVTRTLAAPKSEDYCLNGLQVDGGVPIRKVLGAVTISEEVIDHAIKAGVQAIVVHHGWHWKGEDSRAIGPRGDMLSKLIKNGISLLAYHLPLDQSPDYGNNMSLAHALSLSPIIDDKRGQLTPRTVCGDSVLLCTVDGQVTAQDIANRLAGAVKALPGSEKNVFQPTLVVPDLFVKTVAICTGGAQRLFHDLQRLPSHLKPDMYITGEISLPQVYLARENQMAYLAGGHHNTETFGILSLLDAIQQREGMETEFFNDWCPV